MMQYIEKLTLKTARDKAKINQIDAAKLLGLSVSTLRNYETGKTFPDVNTIHKMEELYNVSYDQIIFLQNENA